MRSWTKTALTVLAVILTNVAAGAVEPTLQELVDALPARGGTIQLKAQTYELAAPLRLRDHCGVRLIGAGVGATTIRPGWNGGDAAPNLALLDLVNATDWEISHLRIDARDGTTWGCGLLLGRRDQRWSGRIVLRQVEILGRFRVAALVNVGAEMCSFETCTFWNTAAAGERAVLLEVQNSRGLRGVGPLSGSVPGETVSNTCHNFLNCTFSVSGAGPDAVCLEVGWGVASCNVLSPVFSAKTPARAAVLLGSANPYDAVHGFYLAGAQVEAQAVRSALEVISPVKGLTLRDCRFLTSGDLLDLKANVEGLRLDGVTFYQTR